MVANYVLLAHPKMGHFHMIRQYIYKKKTIDMIKIYTCLSKDDMYIGVQVSDRL